ncbi:unnamed protein product [Musa hybrid cultivar]
MLSMSTSECGIVMRSRAIFQNLIWLLASHVTSLKGRRLLLPLPSSFLPRRLALQAIEIVSARELLGLWLVASLNSWSSMATPLVASLSVAAAAMGGRYLIQAWQAFKARPVVPRVRRFYPGGFEQQMTRREAALILGVREHAPLDKIKEAHRRAMVANHPDSGGSHYLASKINEAKDVFVGKLRGGSSMF